MKFPRLSAGGKMLNRSLPELNPWQSRCGAALAVTQRNKVLGVKRMFPSVRPAESSHSEPPDSTGVAHMAKIRLATDGTAHFECPGCDGMHGIPIKGENHPVWGWNGSVDAPTLRLLFCCVTRAATRIRSAIHSFETERFSFLAIARTRWQVRPWNCPRLSKWRMSL